ncbi:uncharacterized protein G2W53_042826 [Senna tora]|uniref:Uncharacterized protein n=1 Tax=Senna tora TaxID=362788 RepID=A0A834SJI1_9FABA|nr:uncharacterized protein G2W53_042826 [Senna tora]
MTIHKADKTWENFLRRSSIAAATLRAFASWTLSWGNTSLRRKTPPWGRAPSRTRAASCWYQGLQPVHRTAPAPASATRLIIIATLSSTLVVIRTCTAAPASSTIISVLSTIPVPLIPIITPAATSPSVIPVSVIITRPANN